MTFLDLVCEEFIAMLKKYDVLSTYDIAVRRYKNYSVFDRTELLRHMGENIINYSFSWVNVPIPQSPVEWRDMDREWEITYRNLVKSSEARKLDPIVMYHGNHNKIHESNFGKFAWDSDSFITCYTVGEIMGGDNVEESIQDNIIVWPYSDTLLRHFSYFPSQIVQIFRLIRTQSNAILLKRQSYISRHKCSKIPIPSTQDTCGKSAKVKSIPPNDKKVKTERKYRAAECKVSSQSSLSLPQKHCINL